VKFCTLTGEWLPSCGQNCKTQLTLIWSRPFTRRLTEKQSPKVCSLTRRRTCTKPAVPLHYTTHRWHLSLQSRPRPVNPSPNAVELRIVRLLCFVFQGSKRWRRYRRPTTFFYKGEKNNGRTAKLLAVPKVDDAGHVTSQLSSGAEKFSRVFFFFFFKKKKKKMIQSIHRYIQKKNTYNSQSIVLVFRGNKFQRVRQLEERWWTAGFDRKQKRTMLRSTNIPTINLFISFTSPQNVQLRLFFQSKKGGKETNRERETTQKMSSSLFLLFYLSVLTLSASRLDGNR
jgi:hypothetical protein